MMNYTYKNTHTMDTSINLVNNGSLDKKIFNFSNVFDISVVTLKLDITENMIQNSIYFECLFQPSNKNTKINKIQISGNDYNFFINETQLSGSIPNDTIIIKQCFDVININNNSNINIYSHIKKYT